MRSPEAVEHLAHLTNGCREYFAPALLVIFLVWCCSCGNWTRRPPSTCFLPPGCELGLAASPLLGDSYL